MGRKSDWWPYVFVLSVSVQVSYAMLAPSSPAAVLALNSSSVSKYKLPSVHEAVLSSLATFSSTGNAGAFVQRDLAPLGASNADISAGAASGNSIAGNHNSISSSSSSDEVDCPNYKPTPPHKSLLPHISQLDVLLFVLVAITLLIAAGGGIGGGAVFIALLVFAGGFTMPQAVALSNITILGGSLANFLANSSRRHPRLDRPLIDWDLIMVMEPTTMVGALVGGYMNKLLPVWFTSCLLVGLLSLLTFKLLQRGSATYKAESKQFKEQQQRQQCLQNQPPAAVTAPQYCQMHGLNMRHWLQWQQQSDGALDQPLLLSDAGADGYGCHDVEQPAADALAPVSHAAAADKVACAEWLAPETPSSTAKEHVVLAPPGRSMSADCRLATEAGVMVGQQCQTAVQWYEGLDAQANSVAKVVPVPSTLRPLNSGSQVVDEQEQQQQCTSWSGTPVSSVSQTSKGSKGSMPKWSPLKAAWTSHSLPSSPSFLLRVCQTQQQQQQQFLQQKQLLGMGPLHTMDLPLKDSDISSSSSCWGRCCCCCFPQQLGAIQAYERHQLPWQPLLLLFSLSCWVVGSDTFKVTLECGSLHYWLVAGSIVVPAVVTTLLVRRWLLVKTAQQAGAAAMPQAAITESGSQTAAMRSPRTPIRHSDGIIHWTPWNSVTYPLMCSIAGVFAGLFGVGGGIVKGPLMLELGVCPEVAAATSATMIMFTAGSAAVVYLNFGGVVTDYALALLTIGFVVTLLGQLMTLQLVRALGRRSIIIFMMSMLMVLAAAAAVYQSVVVVEAAWHEPRGMWQWGSICKQR